MKLASLVNLKPIKEESGAFGMTPRELADTYSLKMLQQMRDEVMMDMENDPSVEPEGGPQADYYGGTLNGLDQAIALKQPKKDVPYDVAIGRMSRDEFEKSSKFNRMNETTEKAWNAIDVSRKAEKEISNKEWNERTGKKLDILKKLNDMGKFKKDFDDERLQGWVDQNYSWQKLSKQFKLNEVYSEMYGTRKPNLKSMADVDRSSWSPDRGGGSIGYMEWEDGTEMTPQEIQDYFEANHELYDDIMQGLNEWYERGPATIDGKEVDVESIEMDGLGSMRKWGPDDGGSDAYILRAEFTDGTQLSDEQKERFADEYPEITQEKAQEQMEEGSCGYGPDGVPGDTPGETKGMPANKRTMGMMRKLIQKEIAKLHGNK